MSLTREVTCESCGGAGTIALFSTREACGECHGTGRTTVAFEIAASNEPWNYSAAAAVPVDLDRVGKFRIYGSGLFADVGISLAIFARVIVLRCAFDSVDNAYRYRAWCPDFDPVPSGAVVPEYMVEVAARPGGHYAVSFRRL